MDTDIIFSYTIKAFLLFFKKIQFHYVIFNKQNKFKTKFLTKINFFSFFFYLEVLLVFKN